MNFMQNVRRIGLVGLTLVAASGSVFADAIIQWDKATPAYTVSTGATLSSTGTAGTRISSTNAVLTNPVFGSGDPVTPAPVYLTFDLKSVGAATGSGTTGTANGTIAQNFTGSFSIKDANGIVLLAGTGLTAGTIATNITTGSTNRNFGIFLAQGGDFTGTLAQQYESGSFDLNLNFSGKNVSAATVNGVKTLSFVANNNNGWGASSAEGTPIVPEPSTFALLGLGVAGLAVGAYRRRQAAAAV
ncbi:MAG: PEP-CTERM sorting domain-containing protein [Schlesneria sp.]